MLSLNDVEMVVGGKLMFAGDCVGMVCMVNSGLQMRGSVWCEYFRDKETRRRTARLGCGRVMEDFGVIVQCKSWTIS